ncbi:hypothetical protein GCM10027570_01380 [Streptomonospora sediminis]
MLDELGDPDAPGCAHLFEDQCLSLRGQHRVPRGLRSRRFAGSGRAVPARAVDPRDRVGNCWENTDILHIVVKRSANRGLAGPIATHPPSTVSTCSYGGYLEVFPRGATASGMQRLTLCKLCKKVTPAVG